MEVTSYLLGKKAGGGGGSGRDWSEIGYSEEPSIIQDGIDYAKEIQQNWDSTITNRSSSFMADKNLVFFPNVDMSNVTNANNMFYNCVSLMYFDEINPAINCNMGGMFSLNKNIGLLSGKKIVIKNNLNNNNIFSTIGTLKLDEVVIETSENRGQNIFYAIGLLEIKKITSNITSREKNILYNCGMDDSTIKVFLNYFLTLTSQSSSYKNLKSMGFTQANVNQAVLLDEWTDLENAGWVTGY